MTPAAVHKGNAKRLHAQRATTLEAAYANRPERFVRGLPTPQIFPSVWINKPEREEIAHYYRAPTVSPDLTGSVPRANPPWNALSAYSLSRSEGFSVLSVVAGTPCTHWCTHAARIRGISDSADPLGWARPSAVRVAMPPTGFEPVQPP